MRKLGAMLAAAVLVTAGIWAAVASTASQAVTPATKTAVQHGQTVQQVRTVHPAVKAGTAARHAPAAVHQAKGENPGENGENGENESDGNETDTHVDPPGQNVDHQCPPDCDTANGEQP